MKKNELKVSVIIENGMVRKEMVEIFYSAVQVVTNKKKAEIILQTK